MSYTAFRFKDRQVIQYRGTYWILEFEGYAYPPDRFDPADRACIEINEGRLDVGGKYPRVAKEVSRQLCESDRMYKAILRERFPWIEAEAISKIESGEVKTDRVFD